MVLKGLAPIAPEGEGLDVPFNRWLFFVDALRDRFPNLPTKYPFTYDWPIWYLPVSDLQGDADTSLILATFCFDLIIRQGIKTDLRPSKEHRAQADQLSKAHKEMVEGLSQQIKGMSFKVIQLGGIGSPHLDYRDLGYLGVFFRCSGGFRVSS